MTSKSIGKPGSRWALVGFRSSIWLGANALGGKEQGGVAYMAHVGGAVTGIAVALLFFDDARYIKHRNAAAEGWSVYEGDG